MGVNGLVCVLINLYFFIYQFLRGLMCLNVPMCLGMDVHFSTHVYVCARARLLNLPRRCRQAPDGRRAEEGDDGDLAQPLPEDPGFAGDAAQV